MEEKKNGEYEFMSTYVQTNVILLPNKANSALMLSAPYCLLWILAFCQSRHSPLWSLLCCFRQNCLRAVLLLPCQIPTIPWVKLLSLTDWAVILCMKIKVVEGTWKVDII